jgi:hypothetical protein
MSKKATRTQATEASVRNILRNVGTSIPGFFLGFDPDTQLAQIQIAIQRVDLNGVSFEPPPLIRVPVMFTGCNYFMEHQIDIGSEGLIIFSQRCIDAWIDQGGIAPNPILRFHTYDDAIFLPGLRSQPNKITSFQNNGIRLRNKDGDKFIWLKNDGSAEITVDTLTINGEVIHNGNTTQTGDNSVTGSVSATVSVSAPSIQADSKELAGHVHPAGTPPGNTGPNS